MDRRRQARKQMICWWCQIRVRRLFFRLRRVWELVRFLARLLRQREFRTIHRLLVDCGRLMRGWRRLRVAVRSGSGRNYKKLRLTASQFCKHLRQGLMLAEQRSALEHRLFTHMICMSRQRHLPARQAEFC